MGIFDKLFGTKEPAPKPAEQLKVDNSAADLAKAVIAATSQKLKESAADKDNLPQLTDDMAVQTFIEYFAPNQDFYSSPGSEKFNAYFGAVNAAKLELANNPDLFKMATKRDVDELIAHINEPKPMMSNMVICGMIFRMGLYAVIKDAVYCVDFCDKVPNCAALYLLLIAQKEPEDQRKQIIDAGDRSDKTRFKAAMESLKILDPNWSFTIY